MSRTDDLPIIIKERDLKKTLKEAGGARKTSVERELLAETTGKEEMRGRERQLPAGTATPS